MVPFADFVNHENVDSGFDCIDENGNTINTGTEDEEKRKEQNEDEIRKDNAEKKTFLNNMKTDLLELETKLRRKMEDEGH